MGTFSYLGPWNSISVDSVFPFLLVLCTNRLLLMILSDWFNVFLLVGAVQGFFMSFLLQRKQLTNSQANKYLILLLLLVSGLLAGRVLFQYTSLNQFRSILLIPDVILFLIGPMMYFFTRTLLRQGLPPQPGYYAHFIPAFIHVFLLNTLVALHLEGYAELLSRKYIIFIFYLIEGGAILHMVFYLAWSVQYFQRYKEQFYEKYAATFRGEDLRHFIIAAILLLGFWTFGFIQNLYVENPDYTNYFIVWFLLVLSVYYLAFRVLLSPELLELPTLHPEPMADTVYENLQREIELLDRHMSKHRPFLNPEIKISDLAKQLELPRQDLSKWINQGFGKNFFDFINEYRVQEFIVLRQHPDYEQHNTLELAFQSGFNSKSAFNRAFRKVTGHSPRSYFKDQDSKMGQAGN